MLKKMFELIRILGNSSNKHAPKHDHIPFEVDQMMLLQNEWIKN